VYAIYAPGAGVGARFIAPVVALRVGRPLPDRLRRSCDSR
jgi:hypothetical protein